MMNVQSDWYEERIHELECQLAAEKDTVKLFRKALALANPYKRHIGEQYAIRSDEQWLGIARNIILAEEKHYISEERFAELAPELYGLEETQLKIKQVEKLRNE